MRYKDILLTQIRKEKLIAGMAKSMMTVLSDGGWMSFEDILAKAEIKPNDPLIFSAFMNMQSHNFVEILGGTKNHKSKYKVIRLTQNGMYHIKNVK